MAGPKIIRLPLEERKLPQTTELGSVGRPTLPIRIRNQDGGFAPLFWARVDTGADVIWMSKGDALRWNLPIEVRTCQVPRVSTAGTEMVNVLSAEFTFMVPPYSITELFSWPCLLTETETPLVLGLKGLADVFKIKVDSGCREDGRFPLGCLELELI